MKTCLFASSQLVARSLILEHMVCFCCYVAAKTLHFPLNRVHLHHKMAENVTLEVCQNSLVLIAELSELNESVYFDCLVVVVVSAKM